LVEASIRFSSKLDFTFQIEDNAPSQLNSVVKQAAKHLTATL